MNHQPWDSLLQDLPLILAGPILQRTDANAVTVWLALRQSCRVELQVYETTDDGESLGCCLLEGSRSTFALGQSLHMVAVTARSATGQTLTSDRLYAYDLQFTVLTPPPSTQTLEQALCSHRFPAVTISYFSHQKPTFVLPPTQLQDLRIVHGSCRKPHGNGFDALPILDCLIESTATQPRQRPHQLFLTGDQIYGDDVADPLLWVASQLGDALLGWEEQLPIGRREPTDVTYCTPKALPAGQRAEVATRQGGFTAGLRGKRDRTTSHLLSLGEYYASYLLVWSPVCWPASIPQGREVTRNRKAIRHWNREADDMRQFIHTLWKVRRALANIPVYSIFDDHDVSDDWNLNQAWCLRVLGRPLGRRAVQNALLAYAVSQAWGNTPEQFEVGQPGEKLLLAAQAWSASQGTDMGAYEAIARYVGMPSRDRQTGLPNFVSDGATLILDRHPEALTWHYVIRSHCHEVIVLDTRTWRGYPADQKAIAPPMLLCPQAFERQLRRPLQEKAQLQAAGHPPIQATFVIAPTNVFGLKVIDWIHHWHLRKNKVFATDVGDAWNINTEALAQLLTTLFEQRQQIVVLSGDIHYSSVVRLSYQTMTSTTDTASVLVQLTSSAMKNEELLTQVIHTRLKDWLLSEKIRRWIGWSQPPDLLELPVQQSGGVLGAGVSFVKRLVQKDRLTLGGQSMPQAISKPDWTCVLEWIPRQKARVSPLGVEVPWLLPPGKRTRQAKQRWLQALMFWQSRWLQEGQEVVGLNNLALVQFQSVTDPQPSQVIQDLYWISPWYPTQMVYSRYESQLVPNQALLANLQRIPLR